MEVDPTEASRLSTGGADLLIRNARVWTGKACDPAAGPVVVVARGVIVALGDDATAVDWIRSHTVVVDVGGRRVVPGLIDSHMHGIRAGLTYLDELDWTEITSFEDRCGPSRTRPRDGRTSTCRL